MAVRKRKSAKRSVAKNSGAKKPKSGGVLLRTLVGPHAAFRLTASNDTVVLLQELDECAARLDQAIIETETKANEAEIAGDSQAKERLERLAETQGSQRTKVANKRIKVRDGSPEMRRAIDGFSSVNNQIEQAIAQNKKFKEYLQIMVQIAQVLDVLLKLALL